MFREEKERNDILPMHLLSFLLAATFSVYPCQETAHPTTGLISIEPTETLVPETEETPFEEIDLLETEPEGNLPFFAESEEPIAVEEPVLNAETEEAEEMTEETVEPPAVEDNQIAGIYLGSFDATAYAVGESTTPNTFTRNGTDVSSTIYTPDGYRIIAVDESIIPLNSLVEVHIPGWEPFVARAADTGGAIVGNIIDVLVGSPAEADQFGYLHGGAEIYLME